jgi:hypothetical protein
MTTAPEVRALGGDISNAGATTIETDVPYVATFHITGTAALLFHRWQSDSVEAKAKAAKGSAAKKTDDIASYVWRLEDGTLGLPGEYLRGAVCGPAGAAKFRQDPRSPRKSALDLFKAGVAALTDLAPITRADGLPALEWDYLDRRRVTVQRAGVTRERPALRAGWSTEVQLMVLLPQYIPPAMLLDVVTDAGRLCGVGDFRPTFGRFAVTRFEVGVQ